MSRTEDAFCGCCCPDGKHCFQTWTAFWDCVELTWTLTPGAKACRTAAGLGWTKTAGDETGCAYEANIQMEACCTVDGDCSELPDTATLEAPFGGDAPTDCCEPPPPCFGTCGCRNIGATATVSFSGVDGIGCVECDLGGGNSAYYNFTGSLGTYTLDRYTDAFSNTCRFHGTFSGTYTAAGTGASGGSCPGSDPCTSTTFTIDLFFNAGTGDWELFVSFDACDGLIFDGVVNQGDCSGNLSFTNSLPAMDCEFNSGVAATGGGATVVFAPCTP